MLEVAVRAIPLFSAECGPNAKATLSEQDKHFRDNLHVESSGDVTLNRSIVSYETAIEAYRLLPQAFYYTFTAKGVPGNPIVVYMIPLRKLADETLALMSTSAKTS